MVRARTLVSLLGAAATAVAVVRHCRGHRVPGGILIGHPAFYDVVSRVVLASFYRQVAANVATTASAGAQVLEVGCGPGHLSIRLAHSGLAVTGLDLDPAMIERAKANSDRAGDSGQHPLSFRIGDVASLPFPDGSFDLVVSTLSMHHWAEPKTGLAEIGRVLRPGGRALVWDIRPGSWHRPRGAHMPDPTQAAQGSPLCVLSASPWGWPGKLSLIQRTGFVRAGQDQAAPTR